jgi:hypothetical protein
MNYWELIIKSLENKTKPKKKSFLGEQGTGK